MKLRERDQMWALYLTNAGEKALRQTSLYCTVKHISGQIHTGFVSNYVKIAKKVKVDILNV